MYLIDVRENAFTIDDEGKLIISKNVSNTERNSQLYDMFNGQPLYVYACEHCLRISKKEFDTRRHRKLKLSLLPIIPEINSDSIVLNLGLDITDNFLRTGENKVNFATTENGLHILFKPPSAKTKIKSPKS